MDGRKVAYIALGVTAVAGVAGVIYYQRRKQRQVSGMKMLGRQSKSQARESVSSNGKTLKHYRSREMPINERIGILQDLTHKSVKDPEMRKLALQITRQCPARDGECESRAIYNWVKSHIRYTGDIGPHKLGRNGPVEGVDLFQTAGRTVDFGGGDCLPLTTLVLRDDFELVPIAVLEPGDRIMADGVWTVVEDIWPTGDKELLEFDLSNGCVLRCTPEHRIFRNVDGRVEEIRASEARIGDDLVTAESIPFSEQPIEMPSVLHKLTPEERAWLLGVYVADGWSDGKPRQDGSRSIYRSAISGQDGQPKEEQKRIVEQLMKRSDISTRWHRKYIALNDPSLARFFATVGTKAWEKQLPSIGFSSRHEVEEVIRGLNADADIRNQVFGTTSPHLALQMRVLRRMLGQSVHIRRVDQHGGFGAHPIYRVTPRDSDNTRRDILFARVRGIRQAEAEPCADMTTDRSKFWLPESDTIVHNCDDHSILNCTLALHNGLACKFRVTGPKGGQDFSHIYAMVGLPKNSSRPKWVALDTTLEHGRFGTEAPAGKIRDYVA